MAVLLLLDVFQGGPTDYARLWATAAVFGGSLALLRWLPEETLARWWFQAGLFLGDGLAATLILRLTGSGGDLFLIYLLIVFGSALTRSARQRLTAAGVSIALYLVSGWRPVSGWPTGPEFWLRALFLAVSSGLMAVLARDSRHSEDDQRRRYEDRLVQVGRLATLGRVAGEVAHRIKGPLTTISVDADVLAHRHARDPHTLKELHEIRDEVERCKRILKDLLDLGRIEEMDVSPLDLRRPVREALRSVETQARRRAVRVSSSGLGSALRVRGDASLLQEAVAALLQNALEAVRDGGLLRVEASTRGRLHRIAVVDDGVGISAEDLERVFEPFFTTKKGEGSGLGLSAALRIAAKHGGTVEAESLGRDRGSRFTLVLPAA
jgi:signal transduction histidine kinase